VAEAPAGRLVAGDDKEQKACIWVVLADEGRRRPGGWKQSREKHRGAGRLRREFWAAFGRQWHGSARRGAGASPVLVAWWEWFGDVVQNRQRKGQSRERE